MALEDAVTEQHRSAVTAINAALSGLNSALQDAWALGLCTDLSVAPSGRVVFDGVPEIRTKIYPATRKDHG